MGEPSTENDTPKGADYGPTLRGLGLNLLVSNVPEMVKFLTEAMLMTVRYADEDFAIMVYEDQEFMLHSDGTYAENPLLALTSDGVIRGAGLELRLYDTNPDHACKVAEEMGYYVIQPPTFKNGHQLREAYISGPDGYVWVPSLGDEPVG